MTSSRVLFSYRGKGSERWVPDPPLSKGMLHDTWYLGKVPPSQIISDSCIHTRGAFVPLNEDVPGSELLTIQE